MSFLNKFNLYLGRWLNVPVTLHWSWMAILLYIILAHPQIAILFVLVFFIVLLHELGHCVAAQHFGHLAKSITLFPMGGVASLEIPQNPKEELVIALGGPAVNVLLVPVLRFLAPLNPIFGMVEIYNIVLLVFNLLPAFPMDGGRVLRSILSMVMKNHRKATVIAGRIGQIFAFLFTLFSIFLVQPMLFVIAVFVWFNADAEIHSVQQKWTEVDRSAKKMADLDRKMADLDRK